MEDIETKSKDSLADAKGPHHKGNVLLSIGLYFFLSYFFERLGFFLVLSFTVYLKLLGYEGARAAQFSQFFWTLTSLASLLLSYLADSVFGRFPVLLGSLFIGTIGFGLISLSSHINISSAILFFIGSVILALGAGGARPVLTVLGADQFNIKDKRQAVHQKHYFQYLYLFANIAAALSSGLIAFYANGEIGPPTKRANYFNSFVMSSAFYAVSLIIILLVSRKLYKPERSGSALTNFIRVCYYSACRNIYGFFVCLGFILQFVSLGLSLVSLFVSHLAINGIALAFSFLGLAFMIFLNDNGWVRTASNSDRFSDQFIADSMALLKILPYIAFAAMFWCVYTQMSSTFLLQGCQMNTMNSLKATQLPMINSVAIIIFVPIFNSLVYPFLERKGYPTSPLQRIGAGLLLASLTMLVSGIVEVYRLRSPPSINKESCSDLEEFKKTFESSMSILAALPQLVLGGLSEILAAITFSDFYYVEVPENVRSVSQALSLLAISFGAVINSNLIKVSEGTLIKDDLNTGNLDTFFFIIFGLGMLNFLIFIMVSRRYVYTSPPLAP
jgi:peptide/histidine transporter 3/4